jgi:hypothetical protein
VKPDKAASDRTRRLIELQRELATAAGFDPAALAPDQRIRTEHAALMLLQRETLTARMIAGHDVDTAELVRINDALVGLLPQAATGEQHIDLARVTDAELDVLEAVATRCAAPGPPEPESAEGQLREALSTVDRWRAMLREEERQHTITRQTATMEARMGASARAKCRELETELTALRQSQPVSPPEPDNPAEPAVADPGPTKQVPPWGVDGDTLSWVNGGSGGNHPALYNASDPSGRKTRGMS